MINYRHQPPANAIRTILLPVMISHGFLVSFPTGTLSASPRAAQKDIIRKRGEHANFVYKGEIYILGGIHNHTSGPAHIEKYNPRANSWTHVGKMSFQRHHVTCGSSVYGNEVWVCGGKLNNGTYTKRVDVYNVKDNTWRRGPDLPRNHNPKTPSTPLRVSKQRITTITAGWAFTIVPASGKSARSRMVHGHGTETSTSPAELRVSLPAFRVTRRAARLSCCWIQSTVQ